MRESMQFIACNVRGTNALGKRLESAEQWGRDKIDVAMISETQKTQEAWRKEDLGASMHAFTAQGHARKRKEKSKQQLLGNNAGRRKGLTPSSNGKTKTQDAES